MRARHISDFQRTPLMRYEQSPRFARYHAPNAPVVKDEEPETEQMWWGYFEGSVENLVGFGASAVDTYWAAIEIPKTQKLAQGNEITAVRFAIAGADVMTDLHVWIAEELPNSLDAVVMDVPVSMDKVNNQAWTEVELPHPYTVPSKSCYIGYTFSITESNAESNYPILIRYNGADIDGSFYIRTASVLPNWDASYKSYGPIALQVKLQGEFPKNSVEMSPTFLDVFALPNGTAEATVTLTNRGTNKVSSIDYVIDEANTSSDEIHMEIDDFEGLNAQKTIRIPMKADAKPGRTIRSITILSVNGEDNNCDATSDGYFVTLSRAVERRTVVEEFTGTWCGWCPKGITGLEKVKQQFQDKAITIAVHGDDPMSIDYGFDTGYGYPSAYVDRSVAVDPYFGLDDRGICGVVGDQNAILAEASIGLDQPILNKAGSVTFKTSVCFNYTNKSANYGLGYVLVADGLEGTGSRWRQANYFCTEKNKEDYAEYEDLRVWTEGQPYLQMTYDHVPIAAKGMDEGSEKTITKVTDGDTLTYSGSIALTGNTVLQSLNNLSVVTVLFNKTTGSIVNAAIQPVQVVEDFAVNKAQMQAFAPTGVVKGGIAQVPVPVANFGRAGVHSIDYSVRAGGVVSDTMRLELKKPITTLGVYENVMFPVAAQPESGSLSHTINIVAINGEKNEATAGKNSTGTLITVAKESKRKTAVEEFTGTWCPWCPRGLAGLKRARDEFKDDVVLMSIHGGRDSEPMQVSTFSNLLNSISGYPSANVNRYRSVDPYMGEASEGWGLGSVIEDENSKIVEAAVDLQQPVLDVEMGVINFQTDVTFQLNRRSAPYLLSYVLVADGLHGEGDDWKQVNAYAAYYRGAYDDDPYMREICNDWEISADVTFNDVAVAGLGIPNGVTGSLKTTVAEGQVQTHVAKFNIKNNKLAQMATELRVIALLYDKTRKCFINADEKKVINSDDTPVRDVNSTEGARPVQRYALDGKQLLKPARGINFVRMSDGSVRKVMEK